MEKNYLKVLPVTRSKEDARKAYDRIARYYDFTEGIFEKKHINKALGCLDIKKGETVLEIGPGTGNALVKVAESVGSNGFAYGIDISPKMVKIATRKIQNKGLLSRVRFTCGDAIKLPYKTGKFDAVFFSFTLELFDTPEIPIVLKEIKRVLKPGGRLGIVSLSKDCSKSLFIKLYEWAHLKFPKFIDCRPIYVSQYIKESGFDIHYKRKAKIFSAPLEIVIGIKN